MSNGLRHENDSLKFSLIVLEDPIKIRKQSSNVIA